ncbi:hypothetical protein HZA56_13320 [Candidatus Poribacteria bacterium]|nr:hypothetical protein [Candidatus Poribacteria bacterium]
MRNHSPVIHFPGLAAEALLKTLSSAPAESLIPGRGGLFVKRTNALDQKPETAIRDL